MGARAPAFSALDGAGARARWPASWAGRTWSWSSSALSKWFCLAQLLSLRDPSAPLSQRGYVLAAISYQSPEELAEFAQSRAINYILLFDRDSETIDAFHLRDPQYKPASIAYGVPQPPSS